jgi:arsenite/tail-anchored protein-transporting ATPase
VISTKHKVQSSKHKVQSTKQKPELAALSSRYLFFGGKGGVGKTTSATATAFYLLERSSSHETILLFSTDPAHSLGDSVAKTIGNKPTQIATWSGARLIGYEMDASTALERFREKHGKTIAEIAERGTFLDEADIHDLLNLSLPGMDEVMALFELSELDRAGTYDRIIVDTAPSGHTTRLLRLPQVFARMVGALDRMSDKHRYIIAHFARRRVVADQVDQFLGDLNERIDRVRELLQNKQQTSFVLVTIPEPLSVLETERYVSSLRNEQIPVTDLIVNRVETVHNDCAFCRGRVEAQQASLSELNEKFNKLRIHCVPLMAQEVRGADALKHFGELVWDGSALPSITKSRSRKCGYIKAEDSTAGFPLEQKKIVIFGGKGGVGKTTAAAAFALTLAKKDPKRRILVFSTDPAHSLSDSFDQYVGESKKKVAGLTNLDAMEIDPGKWFDDLKNRYRAWTNDLFASIGGGSKLEIKFDREAMQELVELTPPGIDEIAALSSISDLLDQQRYETIVLDTAPTGHLIRFLELPQVALSWVRTFIKLLLKYQHIVHATRIAEELIALSKSIKRVLALLTDTEACEFIGVAIAERMSLEETSDLATSLNQLQVPMQKLLINGVVPEAPGEECSFCRTRRRQQLEVIAEFKRRVKVQLFSAPQQPFAVHGPEDLLHHFSAWTAIDNPSTALRSERSKVKNVKRPGTKLKRR